AGVGTQSTSAKTAAGQLFDTAQIAEAAQAYVSATGRHRAYFFAKDLGLRGLLATLREHDQLVSFVSTELTALASAPGSRRAFEQQLEFLAAVVSAANNQALARTLHLSRLALYARVTRLARQRCYSLEDDAEQRTATHLALMAYRVNPDGMYAVLRQRFQRGVAACTFRPFHCKTLYKSPMLAALQLAGIAPTDLGVSGE